MIKLFAILFALLLSPFAQANYDKVAPYTLDDCINIALKQHLSLKISDAQIAMAEALHLQAMSAYYPRLNASFSARKYDEDKTFSIKGDFTLPSNVATGLGMLNPANPAPVNSIPMDLKATVYDRDTVTASVNLSYPIFTGLKRSSIVSQAEKGILFAEQGRRKTNLDIVHNVKKYYHAAQFAIDMEMLANEALITFQVLEGLTEHLYKNKSLRIKKTDYLRTKTTTALAQSMLNEAEYARELAHEALGNAMGQPWNSANSLAKSTSSNLITMELQELIDTANNFNPEIQQLSLALQISEYKITEAKSGYYPTLGVQATATKLWNNYDSGLVNNDNSSSWNITVGIDWDLFSGFETVGKVNHAKAEQRKIKNQRILLDQAMALQVKLQFLKIKSSAKQMRASDSAYGFAQENRQLHIRAYHQDMVETKEVIESQLVESYTRSVFLRSRYALEMGLSTLEYLLGQNIEQMGH